MGGTKLTEGSAAPHLSQNFDVSLTSLLPHSGQNFTITIHNSFYFLMYDSSDKYTGFYLLNIDILLFLKKCPKSHLFSDFCGNG
jgi:hypothetical protein